MYIAAKLFETTGVEDFKSSLEDTIFINDNRQEQYLEIRT